MKFYLINPRLPLSFTGHQYSAPLVFKKYSNPPLGLLTVAGMIPPEHQVALCDENVEEIDWERDCDVVGITGMHLQKPGIKRIAERFRRRGKLVVLGGPSVMATPERYAGIADVLIVGEAEHIWPECIRDLERGAVKPAYYARDSIDLRMSPVPRFELASPRDYLAVGLQTTRGCPFKCEFCDIITLYGRTVRVKPVEQVVKEVERLVSLGWDRLMFVDDNFIGDPRYTIGLMEALVALRRRLPRPFFFSTQATINLAQNPRLLRLLYDGGCRSVFIGIETVRISSLQETLKFQNVRKDLLGDVERIQSHGIAVFSGLIVGFDHDDAAVFAEQSEFVNAAKIPFPLPSLLGALPNTPLHTRLAAENRLIPDDEFELNASTNIIPKLMTRQELDRGYRSLVISLYEPKQFAERVLGELERLKRTEGQATNHRWPLIAAGFIWVWLWFVFDPQRRRLLEAFARIVPKAVWRHRRVADLALHRLVVYRHVCRFVAMVEERPLAKRSPHADDSIVTTTPEHASAVGTPQ